MRIIDDLIVKTATAILRGVMAVGAGLVYVQFFALTVAVAMVGTTALAVILAAAKAAIFGG
ncbi:hypothetical protein UNR30_004665 [Salmonella enterica]|jgi:hypothetical protein|uniref:Uncharacterized protein n=1 Tax=bioreactor metagenome TaxID=1076179 RepID=A0A645EK02_9ZZZZ|nr:MULTISPECIES: hypothetical protein [Gammaproteobacteria]EFR2202962.1 hypothetical protein [Salmonella enterica]EIO7131336.1 hypothetical protein [Escherichia coli]BBE29101.1 hypothetical protein [uncultured bacterium]ELZ4141847.1 hypothetical protein [Salmonella enterica]BBE29155.1 hypothetical protein [uncultured bacterium]